MKKLPPELEKAWNKTKLGLMMHGSVFITTVAFGLKVEFTDTIINTAGTNGTHLYFNIRFFMSLTPDQRVGLYAHEVWHVCYKHMERGGKLGLDDDKWNIAADHLINLQLIKDNYSLPPNGYADPKYAGMSTRQIYDKLPDCSKNAGAGGNGPQNPGSSSTGNRVKGHTNPDGTPYQGDLIYVEEGDKEKESEITNLISRAIVQSEMSGEDPGTIPADIRRTIHELQNPVLPWRAILQNFMSGFSKDDYSWARPNKRFTPEFYLPTLHSEGFESMAIAVDTSGSVDEDDLRAFLSEIEFIKKDLKPQETTVLDFDTKIHNVHKIGEYDSMLDIEFEGGGGTRIKPVIDWGNEHNPTVLLIFTDGYFDAYEPDVNFPVMWIIYDNPNFTSNIGEVVMYD
jgi:predicted metal-dependent peptidase